MAKKMVYQVQDRDWELLPIFVYKNGFDEYEVVYYDNDMDNKMFIGVFKTFDLAKGNIMQKFNPQSMLDAFWFPKRKII